MAAIAENRSFLLDRELPKAVHALAVETDRLSA